MTSVKLGEMKPPQPQLQPLFTGQLLCILNRMTRPCIVHLYARNTHMKPIYLPNLCHPNPKELC